MLQLGVFVALVVCLIRPGVVPDPVGVGDQLSWSLLCFCAAAPIVVYAFADEQRLRTPLDWFLAAFLLLVIPSWVTSVDRQQSLLAVIGLVGNVAVYYATVATLGRRAVAGPVFLAILVAGIAILELIALEFHLELTLLTRPAVYDRPEGWGGYPELGLLAAILLAILIAVAMARQRWWQHEAALVLICVTLVEVALLYSRTAWIAVVGVIVAAIAVSLRSRQVWRLAIVGAIMLAIGGVLVWQNPTVRNFAANLVGIESQVSGALASQRMDIWRRTARMIGDYPWSGVGPGNFARVYEPVYNPHLNPDGRRGGHAHNLWLHQAAELGLPGGIAYVALWMAVLVMAWRRASGSLLQQATFLVLIAVAVRSLGDNMFFSLAGGSARLHTLTWMFFALASATRATTEKSD